MGNILRDRDSMINEVINTLMQYQATKTGDTHSLFTGIKDFRIDELEMLEFLFENCSETIKTLEKECEKYQQEFKKNPSVSWLIMQTTFELNKIYHFGWLTMKENNILDTVKDISEISMKDRHIKYLNQLRSIEPNIDEMFIKAYNQCYSNLNFYRTEQCFTYLYNELTYEEFNMFYGDFATACPSGIHTTYFDRRNYGYHIMDTEGNFCGTINFIQKDLEKNNGYEWMYRAVTKFPDHRYMNKAKAEIDVEILREFRNLIGISDLDWKVVFANHHDFEYQAGDSIFKHIDVPRGFVGEYRKASKDINKKYAPIIAQINSDFKESKEFRII
ncbi:MAG: hypothetical protein ACYDG2_21170 [Ruminiclostridium sp.]